MPERDIRIRIFIQDENIAALEKMAVSLQKAAGSEKALQNAALKKNKAIKKQKKVVDDDKKSLDNVDKKTRTWTQSIIKNVGKVLEWAVATGLVYGAIQTLRTGVADIIDVEFAMAGLTKVMLDGERRAAGLRSELLRLGQQYGELGADVVDASTEWARLQISTIEIAHNAETALLAQAVAEMQVVDATRYLIASMQQFEQTSFANLRTLDQWNELSNRMAVRAQDLAAATARAGSVIHNAGDSMAFLNGMTAALVQATGRSGQEIGNAIRTFGTYTFRLRSVTKLEEAGIQVRNKQTGSLRRFGDIMTQTAIKWDSFSDTQQRALAQAIAGTRRQNEFLTLMREFPEVLKAAVIAAESFGSAEKEAGILLDTAQKKAERLRAGMQRLMVEFGNTGPLKKLLDMLNALIEAIINVREVIISVSVVVGLLAVRAAITAIGVKKLVGAIKALASGFALLNPWVVAAIGVAIAAGAAWRLLRSEISFTADELVTAAQKEAGVVAGFDARAVRLEFLIAKYRDLQKAQADVGGDAVSRTMKAFAQDMEILGKNIDKSFAFDFDDPIKSLEKLDEILKKMKDSTDERRISVQEAIRSDMLLVQNRIKFGKEYIEQLKTTTDTTVAFKKAHDKALFVSTLSVEELLLAWKRTGFVAHNVMKEWGADSDQAKEALKAFEAILLELEKTLSELMMADEFQKSIEANLLSIEELKAQIDLLDEATRHRAAMAELAGATELNTLILTSKALEQHIALVKDQFAIYDKAKEKTDKLTKLLGDLEAQLRNVNNVIIETRKEQAGTQIIDALEKQITAIKNTYAAQIEMANGVKDNVKAAELQIQSMQEQASVTRAVIGLFAQFGFATDDLSEDLDTLNTEISLEAKLLELLIRPLQRAKEQKDALKKAEKEHEARIESLNQQIERQIMFMKAYGQTEMAVATLRVQAAEQALKMAKHYGMAADAIRELEQALADAQVALETTPREEILEGLDAERSAMERNMALMKAAGDTDIQQAQRRIDMIQAHMQQVTASALLQSEKDNEGVALKKELADAQNELTIANIEAANDYADAWEKAYEKRRNAWAKLIGRGLTKKGVLETLERIQQEMVDRWIRSSFAPIIDKLTDWEFSMLGIDPEQMRLQAENRDRQLQVLRQGGQAIFTSMKAGGDYSAAAIRSAMQGTPMPAGMGNVPEGVTPTITVPGGDVGGFGAGAYGLSLAPFVIGNIEDWTTERGGGWRAAGAGAGGIIGGILGGGNPAAIAFGAQMGNSLVNAIQGLGDKLDDNTEQLRPRAETLRQQIGGAINRGTFGNASSITYYQEFNLNMGFFLPEREGIRRAAVIMKAELQSLDANVM